MTRTPPSPLVSTAVLAAFGACSAAGDPGSSAHEEVGRAVLAGDSRLAPLFREAERESGVPAEILATVAYALTRLTLAPTPLEDGTGGYSEQVAALMASTPAQVAALDRAAFELGLNPQSIAADARANIRAGARALGGGERHHDGRPALGSWRSAVEAWGGRALADEVMRRLGRGWRGLDDERRSLMVTADAALAREGATPMALPPGTLASGYPAAAWDPADANNFMPAMRGVDQINYVIVHTTEGPYADAIAWFKNPIAEVSAHYVVRSSDGMVTQMVRDEDIAWHDKCFNTETIGIEHEGFVADPDKWYTETMYIASARLAAWLSDAYDVPQDRTHILGHGEAPDCSDHTDPGSGWDWKHYMELVASGGEAAFAAMAAASSVPSEMISGDEAIAWVELVNLGNVGWGIDETRLGTQDPEDRASPFYAAGKWLSASRPAGADGPGAGPGKTARFTFTLLAPEVSAPTKYVEAFQLVQEGMGAQWFGSKMKFAITVVPRGYDAGAVPPAKPGAEHDDGGGSDGGVDAGPDADGINPTAPGAGGCGCRSVAGGRTGASILPALALVAITVRRRRR